MNELKLVKKVNWKDTFRDITEPGQYEAEILASDANPIRVAASFLNTDETYHFNLSVKIIGNTAIITAE